MSGDLEWLVLRKNSCFVLRRGGYELGTDASNLAQLNSQKFNSLIGKTVRVNAAGEKVAISFKGEKGWSVPVEFSNSREAKKHLKELMIEKYYRPDLFRFASKKVNRLFFQRK